MRIIGSSTHFLLLTLALMCAFGAAVVTGYSMKSWKSNATTVFVEAEKVETATVIVASEPLRYGTELTRDNLREITWPKESLPNGAITKISELLDQDGKTVALSFMEVGEPVLKWKITGPGQRASLSAMVRENRKAVSIRVNEVLGVGGFVLPGDHVDILLTRNEQKRIGTQNINQSYTDLLLQNIRVLGVDQMADDKNDKPALAKTITVEVDINDAQKLVLASTVGTLSLTLRGAGTMQTSEAQRVTLADLADHHQDLPIKKTPSDSKPADSKPRPTKNIAARISVTRALERSEYSVHRE